MPGKKLTDNSATVQRRFPKLGTITRKTITKQQYTSFKQQQGLQRQGGYTDLEQKTPTQWTIKRSATLRMRKMKAKRQSLAKANVKNPGFLPAINNKAHGVPDRLGGPDSTGNLVNEYQEVNLKLHKRIENAMAHFMKERKGSNDTNPLKRRGSMEMVETLDPQTGESTQRDYYVHTDAGTGQERFDHYRMKKP